MRSTAFLLLQRCLSSPNFSRSLDHRPSISILLGILYPGHFIDNSSLSGPYVCVTVDVKWDLQARCEPFIAVVETNDRSLVFTREVSWWSWGHSALLLPILLLSLLCTRILNLLEYIGVAMGTVLSGYLIGRSIFCCITHECKRRVNPPRIFFKSVVKRSYFILFLFFDEFRFHAIKKLCG